MTDSELRTMLRRELDAAEPPLHLDATDLRRRGRRRRLVRQAGAGTAVAVVVAVAGISLGLALDDGDGSSSRVLDPTTDTSTSSPSPSATDTPSERPSGPGTDEVTALSDPLLTRVTGDTVIQLGPRPDGATRIAVDLTCVTPGTLTLPNGDSSSCDVGDPTPLRPHAPAVTDTYLRLKPGQDTLVIEAGARATFDVLTTYVGRTFVPDPVNAHGETYGEVNDYGTPDLIGVIASNGKSGYAHARDYQNMDNGETIPVYEVDGTTRIGVYRSGG